MSSAEAVAESDSEDAEPSSEVNVHSTLRHHHLCFASHFFPLQLSVGAAAGSSGEKEKKSRKRKKSPPKEHEKVLFAEEAKKTAKRSVGKGLLVFLFCFFYYPQYIYCYIYRAQRDVPASQSTGGRHA